MSLELQNFPTPEPEVDMPSSETWGDWGTISGRSGGRSRGRSGGRSRGRS